MKKLLNEWKKYLAESLNEQGKEPDEVLVSKATYNPPEPAKQKCDEKSTLYAKRGFAINPTKFLGDLDKALVNALELKTYTGKDSVQELNNWSLYTYIPSLLLRSHCLSPQPTKVQLDQKLGDLYTMLSEAEKMMKQKAPETYASDPILGKIMYLNMEYLFNAISTARVGDSKDLKKVLSKLKPIQMTNN